MWGQWKLTVTHRPVRLFRLAYPSEVDSLEEIKQAVGNLRHLIQLRKSILDELDELSLKRSFAGQCEDCPPEEEENSHPGLLPRP